MQFLAAVADFRGNVSSGNHKRIWIILSLFCSNNRLSALSRSFLLHAAGVNLKSIRHGHEQIPFLRGLAARAEESVGGKQPRAPRSRRTLRHGRRAPEEME